MASTTTSQTHDITPAIEQSLTKVDQAVKSVYTSQESLAFQLDRIEALLAEFNHIKTPSLQIYIDKLLKIKEIVDTTQKRVEILTTRAENAKQTIRERHQALARQDDQDENNNGNEEMKQN